MASKPQDEDVNPPVRALFSALRALHVRAGEPSSRAIARGAGGLSHTTVHGALRGARVPSWPVLAKLVKALDGDEEEFRELWAATRDAGIASEPLPVPAASSALEVSVFASYSHVDNDATYQRISKIILGIKGIYESLTGSTVEIFRDADSISLGENWKDRIRMGLSSSSILLAFVSPAYLRSESCREELREYLSFLSANSRKRLIIPLIYADFDRIEARFSGDDLWIEIKSLQAMKLEKMRSLDEGTSEWIQAIESISYRIEDVLSSFEAEEENGDLSGEIKSSDEPAEGLLELFAGLESSAPQLVDALERFKQLLEELGEETTSAGPKLSNATTFGSKLAISKRLAEAITPISLESVEISQNLLAKMKEWDTGVRFVMDLVAKGHMSLDDEGTIHFLDSIAGLAEIGVTSLGQLDEMRHAIDLAKGVSAHLNKPLIRIQQALLMFAEISGIFRGWKDELDALMNPGDLEE